MGMIPGGAGVMIPGGGGPMVPVGVGIGISPGIVLSNNTVADNAAIGFIIGQFSVVGGSGSYTFTLTSNPNNLFSISSPLLEVAASLATFDGINLIAVHADNGAGSTFDQAFIIHVTSAGAQSEPVPIIF